MRSHRESTFAEVKLCSNASLLCCINLEPSVCKICFPNIPSTIGDSAYCSLCVPNMSSCILSNVPEEENLPMWFKHTIWYYNYWRSCRGNEFHSVRTAMLKDESLKYRLADLADEGEADRVREIGFIIFMYLCHDSLPLLLCIYNSLDISFLSVSTTRIATIAFASYICLPIHLSRY